jgi:hypothetical protein
MAKSASPYYSKGSGVYHVFSDCSAGKSIKKSYRVSGKGNKKLCGACRDIKAGKRTR